MNFVPQPHNLLIVDDDTELCTILCEYFASEGLEVTAVHSGQEGIRHILSGEYSAVLLDVMMPRMNGLEVLRYVRQMSSVPILMLTARGDQIDRIAGLEYGADDYVAKPCHPRELLARLRAVLRRGSAAPGQAEPVLRHADLVVNTASRRVVWNGNPIDLTVSEFNMLVTLMRSGDVVATKDALSLHALGRVRQNYDRSVDVHISNLRIKLEQGSGGIVRIETIRGIGYRLQVMA